MIDLLTIADRLFFPEGPVAVPDGSLVVCEIGGERLTRINRDGHRSLVAEAPGGPNGAALGPDGRLYSATIPHAVGMIGTVSTRSVMIATDASSGLGKTCRVLGVSPLLGLLLQEAAELPVEYDEHGRDGLVMRLVAAEIERARLIPLVVPFPARSALARRCHAFLERPGARAAIDGWADALAMNRRSFTRLFRRKTGMSFAEWGQQACLAVTLPLLAAGEAVTTVAFELGYESSTAFSMMFKRVVGTSPSRHR